MAIASTSGAKIYISASGAVPTANSTAADASDYAALTYVEIGDVESVSEFGDEAQTITAQTLGDARVRKRKGVRDAGDITITVLNNPLDNGQKAMVAAEATEFTYAFKVVLADGADSNDTDSVFYFRALVSSARLSGLQPNEIIKRTFVALIDSEIVEVPSAAVSGP